MARHLHSRLRIKGHLVAQTPLHVGGYGESFETDMALARNGKDKFYIPGTSLTGALRNWFAENFPGEANNLWGFQKDDKGHASFVFVDDMTLPNQVQSELRDGVGINRFYGTAAEGAKFDRAILPKGTRLDFEMTVDMQNGPMRTKAMLGHLLDALSKGNIRLGASKTRGLGRVKFERETIEEYSLDSFDAILNVVAKKPAKTYATIEDLKKEDAATTPSGPQLLTITISWKPKSALMVKAGYEGIGVDTLSLTSGNGKDRVSLVLPGSSIKGAFRAHAERIVRTLLNDTANGKEFHDQIKLDIISELFGAKKENNGQANHLGLGALSFDDCYFDKQMNVADWQAVETGKTRKTVNGNEEDVTYTEQELWRALKKIEGNSSDLLSPTKEFAISHHVAIDRWTGGASEGALYSVLQPSPTIGWDDICLSLDFSRLSGDKKLLALMLLLLVLRDFAENRVPLGFATNRGMGEVKDVSFAINGAYEVEWKNGNFDFKKPTSLKSDLETEWKQWLEQN